VGAVVVDSVSVNWLDPVNLGLALFIILCAIALVMLWLAVRRGALRGGYAVAPGLLVAHGLIFGVVSLYIRNTHFAAQPSVPVSLWASILLNQAVIMLILILAYRLRGNP